MSALPPPVMAGALDLLAPHLAVELVPPDALASIWTIASLLPARYRGIFECRLGAKDARVDFHQCLLAGDGEPQALADQIATTQLNGHETWQAIAQFCGHWSDPESEFGKVINNVWLEFDVPASLNDAPVPALFLTFGGEQSGERSLSRYRAIANDALGILLTKPTSEQMLANVYRCAEQCPLGVGITHLGLMLSRPGSPLRLNVKGLAPDQLAGYLVAIEWPGSVEEATMHHAQLAAQVESLVVCLDVAETVSPNLGFECFTAKQQDGRAQWVPFLDWLVVQELCSPEKRGALLAWSGLIAADACQGLWPEDLIVQSLLRPPTDLSLFTKRISHVKVSLAPDGRLEAKGYLSFSHSWIDLARAGQPEDVRP